MLWPARLLVYSLCAWLGLWIIFPAVGGGALGMLLAAPTAALAIALDIFLSARVLGESSEREAVRRVIAVDKMLGGHLEGRGQIETDQNSQEEPKALPRATPQLPEGSSNKRTSPPSDR